MPDDDRITLRDHLQSQIAWLDKYFDQRLKDAKEAIEKADQQLNGRLQGMNEFRKTLEDQAGQFVTRREHDEQGKRIAILERNESSGEGRTRVSSVFWAIAGSIFTAVVVVVISKLIK